MGRKKAIENIVINIFKTYDIYKSDYKHNERRTNI